MIRLFLALILVINCELAGRAAAEGDAASVLNRFRAENGLRALSTNSDLQRAALSHAEDMLLHRYFSHTGHDGSTVANRVTRTGYRWCYVAENIAQGQPDLEQVMYAWAQSPGHRANMLSPNVTEFGLAAGPGYIWVMVLAARNC